MAVYINGRTGISYDGIDSNSIYSSLPSGSIIQVVNTIYTGRAALSIPTSDVDVLGGLVNITPKLTGSKILIIIRYLVEIDNAWNVMFNIKRDGTKINLNLLSTNWSGIGAASQTYGPGADNYASTPEFLSFQTYDNVSTIAGVPIQYKLTAISDVGRNMYINRTAGSDGASGGYENGTSEMIVMEIKG